MHINLAKRSECKRVLLGALPLEKVFLQMRILRVYPSAFLVGEASSFFSASFHHCVHFLRSPPKS